jgi:hypothetical protein
MPVSIVVVLILFVAGGGSVQDSSHAIEFVLGRIAIVKMITVSTACHVESLVTSAIRSQSVGYPCQTW